MKKIAVIIVMCFMFMGCGAAEQFYDEANYESLTNEVGTITLYAFNEPIKTYHTAKVLYSESNSMALWIKTDTGELIYWQGFALIELN